MSRRACGPNVPPRNLLFFDSVELQYRFDKAGRSSSVIVVERLISARALVYVPRAVPKGHGADHLASLSQVAKNTSRLHLEAQRRSELTWCVSDFVQIAAERLA